MVNFGRCLSLVSFTCFTSAAALTAHGQGLTGLPDSPGYTLMARASVNRSAPENSVLPISVGAPDLDIETRDSESFNSPRQMTSASISSSELLAAFEPRDTSAPPAGDPPQTEKPPVDATTGVPQREATWRSLPGDFLHDQKDLWMFPFQVMRGRHLLPTAIVLGGTVGLIYADSHDMPYFVRNQQKWDKVNDVFDPLITTGEVISLPAGLMTAGYIRHDDREVNTALLAVEAYGDSVIINLAMKAITRRQRPSDVAPTGNFHDTFFNGGKSPLKGSSFPSGHSTAVWSVATVVAERYRHRGKPWIPVLSYTLATAISLSRITQAAHFPSDVWLGASLGYSIAKYQTLSPRR